jgi:hypothetical protein
MGCRGRQSRACRLLLPRMSLDVISLLLTQLQCQISVRTDHSSNASYLAVIGSFLSHRCGPMKCSHVSEHKQGLPAFCDTSLYATRSSRLFRSSDSRRRFNAPTLHQPPKQQTIKSCTTSRDTQMIQPCLPTHYRRLTQRLQGQTSSQEPLNQGNLF